MVDLTAATGTDPSSRPRVGHDVAPSTTVRWCSSVSAGDVPASIHRRSVSSLTLEKAAASRIRLVGMHRT